MKRIFAITAALIMILSTSAMAGNDGETNDAKSSANISGVVIDQNSGEILAGVAVKVEGTDIVCYSDLDGKFNIDNLKPGSYNLVLSYISYNKSFVENVTVDGGDHRELKVHLIEQEQ